jgi:hypothetical protein
MKTESNDVVPERSTMKVRRKTGGSNSEWPGGKHFPSTGAVGLKIEFNELIPVEIQIQRLGERSLRKQTAEPWSVPAAASSPYHNNQKP